jgi:hypothetical protein
MKQKAQEFISKLQSVLDQDLKNLQIEVLVWAIEAEHSDSLNAAEVRNLKSNLSEINFNIKAKNIDKALTLLGQIPDAYLTRSQRALREKVLNGESIADLSSFNEAVEGFRTATSDDEIMSAMEKANWAVTEIINTESKYGPLQSKVSDLFKEFKDSVAAKVEKKVFLHPTVLRKVAELTVNNADRINSSKQASEQQIAVTMQNGLDFRIRNDIINQLKEELAKELRNLDEKFKADINRLLNIPAGKNDEVTKSKEYKHFMKLCFALRDRIQNDLEDTKYSSMFSEEAREARKRAHEESVRYMPWMMRQEEESKFNTQERVINILEFFHKFKKFLDKIWKALLTLVDKFGLLPETTQVRNLKNSGQEWQKFVAERGSEVVKNHGLEPLNF